MVHGYFRQDKNLPLVEVSIFSGEDILQAEYILDTGFSGGLKIDRAMAQRLHIIPVDDMETINADNEHAFAGLARCYVELEGRKRLVDILISDGPPLAGIGLFTAFGYTIVVDCKRMAVHLEMAP